MGIINVKAKAESVRQFIKKIRLKIKNAFDKPTAFLRDGRAGGIILCVLLAAQFVYGSAVNEAACIITSPGAFALSAVLVLLAVELTVLLERIVFGVKKRSFGFFLGAVIMLAASSSMTGAGVLSGLLLGFSAALAADIFGRCVWSTLIKKNRMKGFGVSALAVSLAVLAAFGVFFRLPGFGKSRVEHYLSAVSYSDLGTAKPEFAKYLQNGESAVLTLSYGTSDCDILTEPVDITGYAQRDGIMGKLADIYFDYSLEEAPVAGKIWYPQNAEGCPALFIVHGNHSFTAESYLGYEYLCEYLASNGYVAVSVDENCCNTLSGENDGRAVLLLENIKAILAQNKDIHSPLYGTIDENRIAIAGHSRGGEAAATACLFNGLPAYPDNGNKGFAYHFNIRSVIAIAPTVDQYMPCGRAVEPENVNYLLIHGTNDQDVINVMGEKQYANVSFTETDEAAELCKASVYVMGANHGQFNSEWGQWDLSEGMNGFLNTENFLTASEQQTVARAFIRAFLDLTLNNDGRYSDLLWNADAYREQLPKTVYQQSYQQSGFEKISDFNSGVDIRHPEMSGTRLDCRGVSRWNERQDRRGGGEGENGVLYAKWNDSDRAEIVVSSYPMLDMTDRVLTFRLADVREDIEGDNEPLHYTVTLVDGAGKEASVNNPIRVYPSLGVQLYKADVLAGKFEYKHQMQTVRVSMDMLKCDAGFDRTQIQEIHISFPSMDSGEIELDDLGFYSNSEFN